MNLALARVAWSRVQHEESMTLYERVKQSLRDGVDPDHVGHIFGVSANVCRAIKQMLDAQDSTDRLMRGLFETHDMAPRHEKFEPQLVVIPKYTNEGRCMFCGEQVGHKSDCSGKNIR